jgi:hypothetical protein
MPMPPAPLSQEHGVLLNILRATFWHKPKNSLRKILPKRQPKSCMQRG